MVSTWKKKKRKKKKKKRKPRNSWMQEITGMRGVITGWNGSTVRNADGK